MGYWNIDEKSTCKHFHLVALWYHPYNRLSNKDVLVLPLPGSVVLPSNATWDSVGITLQLNRWMATVSRQIPKRSQHLRNSLLINPPSGIRGELNVCWLTEICALAYWDTCVLAYWDTCVLAYWDACMLAYWDTCMLASDLRACMINNHTG